MIDPAPERNGAGLVSQRFRAELRRLEFDQTLVVRVDAGIKTVRHRQKEIEARPGDLVVIPQQHIVDIVNAPDSKTTGAIYQASILTLSTDTIGAPNFLPSQSLPAVQGPLIVRSPSTDMVEAFARAHDALRRQGELPDAIVRNRTQEIVLWIEAATGHRLSLPFDRSASFARRVRQVVSADVTLKWDGPGVAKRLAVSDATLRRRLRAERTTFADQLLEARMMRALELLQSSDWPVTTIAAAVGYESPSRFAERFRERFGATPSVFRAERAL